MDTTNNRPRYSKGRSEWRFTEKCLQITLYLALFTINTNCQTMLDNSHLNSATKNDLSNIKLDVKHCHNCHISNKNSQKDSKEENSFISDMINTVVVLTKEIIVSNKTGIGNRLELLIDDILNKDKYEIIDGIEIQSLEKKKNLKIPGINEGRGLFSAYTYEYRLLQKFKNFVDTHIVSINLPKAARFMGFRSFGLKKFFLPLFIGAQVFKSILLAMFLPSILGSFGKILGKGISHISTISSQASYPPATAGLDNQDAYNADSMAYGEPESQDGQLYEGENEMNEAGNVDLSRLGNNQKTPYSSNAGMETAATNNYKVFQKIPASSMILSNYDPFYSPLLSRLDGIFARLGLAPRDNSGGPMMESTMDIKLESCREQLICMMYASPAKYAPYSNLVSAQLSRELNELRRPVSDNPEILRFFRYMRAARRGQEDTDCVSAYPACSTSSAPQHAMISAYHDINKLVTARKL